MIKYLLLPNITYEDASVIFPIKNLPSGSQPGDHFFVSDGKDLIGWAEYTNNATDTHALIRILNWGFDGE